MLGILLIVLIVLFLFGGVVSWAPGGYGYGYGHRGIGVVGIILIVILVLVLLGRL